MANAIPVDAGTLVPEWLEGPHNAGRLDVGIVTVSPGGATPPHVHIGGQVIVVMTGRGFVEAGGERHDIRPGDIVIAPPGELHTHGAASDDALSHLTVTTGGYHFPSAEGGDG
jgi:quercetin dioxygenase-like cupin family protein